jgi:hypothetical protein
MKSMRLLNNLLLGRFTQLTKPFVSALGQHITKTLPQGGGYENHSHAAGLANGITMVVLFFGWLLPYLCVYFCPTYMLAQKVWPKLCFCLFLCLWLGLSSFLEGKACFCVFLFSEDVYVDRALISTEEGGTPPPQITGQLISEYVDCKKVHIFSS